MNQKSALQFATMLRTKHPKLYRAAVLHANETGIKSVRQPHPLAIQNTVPSIGIAGLADSDTDKSGWMDKFVGFVAGAGSTYLGLKNQRDILKLNIARAKQGLPPIDAGSMGPVISTQVQLPPDVVDKITASAGLNINKILIFGALGLGAYLLMNKLA